jgi:hypothetical protein
VDDENHDPRASSSDPGSALYENAVRQANQEAALECASKAEEALVAMDFDKAVSFASYYVLTGNHSVSSPHPPTAALAQEKMFHKADRLAPGSYLDKIAMVQRKKEARLAELQRLVLSLLSPL